MRPATLAVVVAVSAGALTLAARAAADEPLRSGYLVARDMTDAEAVRALDAFQSAGQISWTPNKNDPHYVDLSSSLDAVSFQYAGKPLPISHVTPQFAVFLVRLAQTLRRGFDVVVLDHAGIYPGRGAGTDVHNRGSAIDVTGVSTIDSGPLQVLADWGNKPKSRPGYRLGPDDRGYTLFQTIYDLAAREAEDDPNLDHTKPPSIIGEHSLIITPDHPDAALAAQHRDHVHIQIGPTRA